MNSFIYDYTIRSNMTDAEVTSLELSYVWQVLWNMVVGNPTVINRKDLQRSVGQIYQPSQTLGCLRVFKDEDLIKCIRNNEIIPNPFKEEDFEQFALTAKGTKLGALYPVPKESKQMKAEVMPPLHTDGEKIVAGRMPPLETRKKP
jgi:hypothetical protein